MFLNFWDRLFNEGGFANMENDFLRETNNQYSLKLYKNDWSHNYFCIIKKCSNNSVMGSLWLYDFNVETRPSEIDFDADIDNESIEKFMLNFFAKRYPEYKNEYVNNILKEKFNDEISR